MNYLSLVKNVSCRMIFIESDVLKMRIRGNAVSCDSEKENTDEEVGVARLTVELGARACYQNSTKIDYQCHKQKKFVIGEEGKQ